MCSFVVCCCSFIHSYCYLCVSVCLFVCPCRKIPWLFVREKKLELAGLVCVSALRLCVIENVRPRLTVISVPLLHTHIHTYILWYDMSVSWAKHRCFCCRAIIVRVCDICKSVRPWYANLSVAVFCPSVCPSVCHRKKNGYADLSVRVCYM